MAATRGKRIDADLELAIKERIDLELSPSQIFRDLESHEQFRGRVNKSTIERRWNKLRPRDPSGPWDWRQGGVEDIRGVLDVLQVVVERTEGRKSSFTSREASMVDTVLRAAPGLHKWAVYLVVGWAIQSEVEGAHIQEIDYLLMSRAWESPEQLRKYRAAVADQQALDLLTVEYILGMHKMLVKEGDNAG